MTQFDWGSAEGHERVKTITKAVRAADADFEKEGGSSRHWVRDHFLPRLEAEGFTVAPLPPARRVTTPHDDPIVRACVHHGGHDWTEDRPGFCTRCWYHADYPEGKVAEAADLRPVKDVPRA